MHAHHDGYPETLSVEVPLDAGFGKTKLWYNEVNALA